MFELSVDVVCPVEAVTAGQIRRLSTQILILCQHQSYQNRLTYFVDTWGIALWKTLG